jgi:hypothetical protein
MSKTPSIGMRVRRITAHREIAIGTLGTIDVVHKDGKDFWVADDTGGFCGWCCFEDAHWEPVDL